VGYPVRLRFTKRGRVRFISHRDVARAFERAFRIVTLPTAFTAGFVPRPKVSFGLALSVGYESDGEYLDVELTEREDPDTLCAPISEALPEGLDVTGAAALQDRAPALQEAITSVSYRIEIECDDRPTDGGLTRLVDDAMASPSLVVTRRRKGVDVVEDVRPAIRRLETIGREELELEVQTHPRGVRPAEIVGTLAGDVSVRSVLRTHQWIERGSARLEPLEADTRPHVPEARAS